MRQLTKSSPFRRDLKKIRRSGTVSLEELQQVLDLLLNDESLPEHLRDHALSGQWKTIDARECHIKPDVLLVYLKPPGELSLLRLGSHAELFGK